MTQVGADAEVDVEVDVEDDKQTPTTHKNLLLTFAK
jgi:hypothetical protein